MKRSLIAFALTGAGIALSGAAHAVNVDVNIGTPAPVVVAPAPAPVIVAPAPAIVVGWHGDRYWDGHRYWERREWEERHRHRGFCPPGHAKKGEC
ncbi:MULTISPECIES: hypothetical protein [pseudomallei group]|uniref:hypothetical protein n=1 Tax=pseudomallei group TaxID=111527 RepID=UPI0009786591|nr:MULTISPECIES: hypothetical protein [pseudomallei group]ONC44825.1 hypothetical protein AQ916_00990 [Burkholderia pseudomallei]QBP62142.1 hypothetical protein E2R29_11715 [Burkholderia pseudomallei]